MNTSYIFFCVSLHSAYIFFRFGKHVQTWTKISGPLSSWIPQDQTGKAEYKVLLREFGFEARPDSEDGAASCALTGAMRSTSRVDSMTLAETLDPREVALTDRSVTFAPDVITSPHWARENFNERLDYQFGLNSADRMTKHEDDALEALEHDATAVLQPDDQEFSVDQRLSTSTVKDVKEDEHRHITDPDEKLRMQVMARAQGAAGSPVSSSRGGVAATSVSASLPEQDGTVDQQQVDHLHKHRKRREKRHHLKDDQGEAVKPKRSKLDKKLKLIDDAEAPSPAKRSPEASS